MKGALQLPARRYAVHSFRAGAATTAAANGKKDSLIRTVRRCESSAYLHISIFIGPAAGHSSSGHCCSAVPCFMTVGDQYWRTENQGVWCCYGLHVMNRINVNGVFGGEVEPLHASRYGPAWSHCQNKIVALTKYYSYITILPMLIQRMQCLKNI